MNNLSKRIITSIILIFILSISLFYNKYIWLFTLIFVSLVLFIEFNHLVNKIWKKEKKTILKFNIFSSLFLLILIYVSYESYNNPPTGLVFIILICIFSDTGGYLIGNLIGGKKLTKISPNKTIIGAIGSIVLSCLVSLFIFKILSNDLIFKALIIGSTTSVACQIGDLFFSYLKRKAKIKDTGSFLPGHGGILDRLDGILLGVPAGIFIITYLS